KDEFVANCSEIDDIIVFFKDGKFKVVKVADKVFVGKNILYVNVFKKNDKRTIYNVVYRDGKGGANYIKRFAVTGVTRDKEYDITQGNAGTKILYFSENPNGEAEVIRIVLKPRPRLVKLNLEKDFSDVAIKGRQSMGNILTKNEIHKISLKQKGGSTLGGRKVWFDPDVLRLNYDGRGNYLGEFQSDDTVLVISMKGEYYTTNFDLTNHFESDLFVVEKFDPHKVWTVALYDAEQKYYYLKRFQLEATQKPTSFLGDHPESKLASISDADYPRFEVVFGGNDAHRGTMEIDAESFIGVKGFKAKGKRIATFEIKSINELEPLRFAEKKQEEISESENEDAENSEEESPATLNTTKEAGDNKEENQIPKENNAEETPKEKPTNKSDNTTNNNDGQMSLF
ncbi:DNA gyrase/topoisomerase IV subunit A, partial [Paludibacteraceae bacterium OttesenSCG-928-F17]|nr:DNA gyrase/topoisomerase IV subunit A [Paludibacteraceae bacterium OttesenSCG-928-F17]